MAFPPAESTHSSQTHSYSWNYCEISASGMHHECRLRSGIREDSSSYTNKLRFTSAAKFPFSRLRNFRQTTISRIDNRKRRIARAAQKSSPKSMFPEFPVALSDGAPVRNIVDSSNSFWPLSPTPRSVTHGLGRINIGLIQHLARFDLTKPGYLKSVQYRTDSKVRVS